jgi:hypothetical protein
MSPEAAPAEAPEGEATIAPVSSNSMIGSASSEAPGATTSATQVPATSKEATTEAEPPKGGEIFDPGQWKAPEGLKVDQDMLKGFAETLNKADLKGHERGEKLLTMHQQAVEKAVQAVTEGNTKAWTDTLTQWETEIKADQSIGGDRLEPTLQSISKALDLLGPEGSKAFKQAMTITGAGSNPAVVRGMAKLANVLTEGGHIPGSPGGGKGKSITELFFPNSPEMKGDT